MAISVVITSTIVVHCEEAQVNMLRTSFCICIQILINVVVLDAFP